MRALHTSMLLAWALSGVAVAQSMTTLREGGRPVLVYEPVHLPPRTARSLVVVLHGGMGNAQRIADTRFDHGLNMNALADRYGFIVAYLNGTPAARVLGADMLAWNAGGGCCGLPAEKAIDDVGYITNTISRLIDRHGIDPQKVFGIGHSNGAMMTQRLICETNRYAAIVAVAGPLNSTDSQCSVAQGKRILSIHGERDQNVPITGGRGTKGISRVAYASQHESQQRFERVGATYTLQLVAGADHQVDHIDQALRAAGGLSIAETSVRFFGLTHQTETR